MGEGQSAPFAVRPAAARDVAAMVRIYNFYVRETTVSFEQEPITAEKMAERLGKVQAISLPWVIAEEGKGVLGYAYASRWKTRRAYRHSAEVTAYVDRESGGLGVGSALYEALLAALPAAGIHVAIGGIALPNPASVAFHERFGFEKVAHFREVGFKFNRWIDVGYWQKIL